jgi:hypothetical protein
MQKGLIFYRNSGYWFLLLIPLVLVGFYPTYFAVLFRPTPSIIHLHFSLMAVWVAMLIVQPFLYKYKKLSLHRKIGKASYVIVPLLLITAYFMIRFSYYRFINEMDQKIAAGSLQADQHQVLKNAATYEALAFLYFGWLGIFYSLAIINRRPSSIHARYMVAAALTMLGPTVDRIVFWITQTDKLGSIPVESISFLIEDCVLAFLLWKDYKGQRSTKALLVSLLIFLTAQLLYFLVKETDAWQSIVSFVM